MRSMAHLQTYDYLTLARGRVFDWIRPLGEDGWRREFPVGLGSLAVTMTHIMISEWYYIQRLLGRDVPPYEQWAIKYEQPPSLSEVESHWTEQAKATRAAIAGTQDWDSPIEYRVQIDDGSLVDVTCTKDGLLIQLAIHEAHHRSQAMHMLRLQGVEAQDIDYNALLFEKRPV